ncbi:MAG: nucleotidyltransferase family protein [Spartobacteria bacterium]|nr:nucleotidyltransferase family protein [Spartobacteria bacterium]
MTNICRTKPRSAGIVLSGGASTRMTYPKGMLHYHGRRLALHQMDLLRQAGCMPVYCVGGAAAKELSDVIDTSELIINDAWETGRFSSVQCGLTRVTAADTDGCIILPVDTAGIQCATIQRLLEAAAQEQHDIIRPTFEGRRGHLLWISRTWYSRLIHTPASQRLDHIVRDAEWHLAVHDAAVVNNINTPEEWKRLVTTSQKDHSPHQ